MLGRVQTGELLWCPVLRRLPRRRGDELYLNWGLQPGDMDEIAALADRIKANL